MGEITLTRKELDAWNRLKEFVSMAGCFCVSPPISMEMRIECPCFPTAYGQNSLPQKLIDAGIHVTYESQSTRNHLGKIIPVDIIVAVVPST